MSRHLECACFKTLDRSIKPGASCRRNANILRLVSREIRVSSHHRWRDVHHVDLACGMCQICTQEAGRRERISRAVDREQNLHDAPLLQSAIPGTTFLRPQGTKLFDEFAHECGKIGGLTRRDEIRVQHHLRIFIVRACLL